jgi:hypothetical protein
MGGGRIRRAERDTFVGSHGLTEFWLWFGTRKAVMFGVSAVGLSAQL